MSEMLSQLSGKSCGSLCTLNTNTLLFRILISSGWRTSNARPLAMFNRKGRNGSALTYSRTACGVSTARGTSKIARRLRNRNQVKRDFPRDDTFSVSAVSRSGEALDRESPAGKHRNTACQGNYPSPLLTLGWYNLPSREFRRAVRNSRVNGR